MTDRADERSADDSSDADPFEYPADAEPRGESEPSPVRSRRRPNDDADTADSPTGVIGWIRWFWRGDTGSLVYVRDALTSLVIVVAIGLLLFAASGVWPPMVAIESGSMEPNMERGDLVFLVDTDRFVPDGAIVADGVSTGVVPADVAERNGRTEFNRPGDVMVFRPNGNTADTPIIHRAMFWVSADENWYDRADPARIGDAENCEELNHCPAPHAGFITKGDNELTNRHYDQASRLSAPVRPDWIIGTAELRVPYLGYVRLLLSGVMVTPVEPAVADPLEPSATRDTSPASANVTAAPVRATPRPA
ncbi:S26 family signal peptidase [Natronomonas salsuginis]|jgi:signal peptidase|uniref:S26 family signal peptidase n=1 Tax=Natronomonas salsuginis TaxID=2217661 RepID=UPI001484F167|nr:S26 family signal peptidase [Natronomonas salsuginis]